MYKYCHHWIRARVFSQLNKLSRSGFSVSLLILCCGAWWWRRGRKRRSVLLLSVVLPLWRIALLWLLSEVILVLLLLGEVVRTLLSPMISLAADSAPVPNPAILYQPPATASASSSFCLLIVVISWHLVARLGLVKHILSIFQLLLFLCVPLFVILLSMLGMLHHHFQILSFPSNAGQFDSFLYVWKQAIY